MATAKRAAETAALPWDTNAGVRLRLFRAREALRGSRLWNKFDAANGRTYDAFSIHELAMVCEEELAKVGVAYSFTVEKWAISGVFGFVEGWACFTCVEQDGEEFRVYTVGEGADNSDKKFGKAISYARKNGLIQGLNLAVGQDNEATAQRPVDQGPAPSASGAAPMGQFAFVMNGRTVTLQANVVEQHVMGFLRSLANAPAVQSWLMENEEPLAAFWRWSPQAAYALRRNISDRIAELGGAAR